MQLASAMQVVVKVSPWSPREVSSLLPPTPCQYQRALLRVDAEPWPSIDRMQHCGLSLGNRPLWLHDSRVPGLQAAWRTCC